MLGEYWGSDSNVPSNINPNPPVQNSTNYYYAGFLMRAQAFFVDGIIVIGSLIVIGLLFSTVNNLLGYNIDISMITRQGGEIIFGIIIYLYFIILTSLFGGTLGKKMAGLKVVKRDFSRPTIIQIILRELIGRTLSNFFIIGYLIVPFNKEKRALHDFLAGTVVLSKTAPTKKGGLRMAFFLFGLPIIIPLLAGLIIMIIGSIFDFSLK